MYYISPVPGDSPRPAPASHTEYGLEDPLSISGQPLLVAMPELQDPNFNQTVTLICEHDENGALGVVINRPLESLVINDVLSQFDLTPPDRPPDWA